MVGGVAGFSDLTGSCLVLRPHHARVHSGAVDVLGIRDGGCGTRHCPRRLAIAPIPSGLWESTRVLDIARRQAHFALSSYVLVLFLRLVGSRSVRSRRSIRGRNERLSSAC